MWRVEVSGPPQLPCPLLTQRSEPRIEDTTDTAEPMPAFSQLNAVQREPVQREPV